MIIVIHSILTKQDSSLCDSRSKDTDFSLPTLSLTFLSPFFQPPVSLIYFWFL